MTGRYTYGHSPSVVAVHAARSAAREAAFFLPHLGAGMRLLDAGCGPGSITLGLAEAVAPGEVVGVDTSESVLDEARALAAGRPEARDRVRFEQASVLALPFADGRFDAAFAHTLLEHLSHPAAALAELRRVVRPGGLIGLRDADWEARSLGPPDSLVEEAADLYARVWRHNGGDPRCGRRLPGLLLDGGWVGLDQAASFRWNGGRAETREFADLLDVRLAVPRMAEVIVAQGWATAERVQALRAACRAWAERPDAFAAVLMVEVVGQRPTP